MEFNLSVMTPNGKIFEDTVTGLRAPGIKGGFGILRGHAPMVVALSNGVLKLTQSGKEIYYGIAPGILEVNREHNVLILSDSAVESQSFDEAQNRSLEIEKK